MWYWCATLVLGMSLGMACAEPLKLVTGNGYPPFTDEQLAQGGLATELVRRAATRAGFEMELTWRPWQHGYQAALDGEFAGTFPYISTPEREKLFHYSAPLFELHFVVFGRAGRALNGKKPETLQGLRYCNPHGWAHLPVMAEMMKSGAVAVAKPYGMDSCMKMVALGRADFAITDREQGERVLQDLGDTARAVRPLGEEMAQMSLHLIIPRNRPDAESLLQRFNAGLAAVPR
ncbi:substrate-binding periplasmic protein [Chitinilyticum piscinae]|uniref:Transporter substrate-binding domain-containing protein n=1 Tax=Chitinilyticum piscinae TaxID=2866724 RepID=A0A8J7FH51_9NEIS|nr:transporter substrate-binding domain-containing protein [Chitinilyticum piscinae]MBE9609085.1 transporter substrate-binding domain-containing protein [Chitinilyticum piscinae]